MNPASTLQSPDPLPQSGGAGVNRPKDYDLDPLRSFRMNRLLAIGVALAVFLVVIAYGLSRHPYYETQALIYVQPAKTTLITDASEGTYDSPRYETYIQQQLQTILRADILTEALKKPETLGFRFPGEPLQSAVARLQKSLKVERVQGSYELSIDMSGPDPKVIANVINAVCAAYIHGERSDELAQSDQQLSILHDELDRVTTDIENSRKEQADLSIRLGVADTSGESADPYDVQLADLRSEVAKAVSAQEVASAQLASVTSGPGAPERLRAAADEVATTDPELSSIKQTIGVRRSALASEMAGLTPRNPQYEQDQAELARLDASLASTESEVRVKAARALEQKLQLDVRRAQDIQSRLTAQLRAKTAIATAATPELQHANELAAQITRLQARYTEVDNAINAIQLERDTAGLVHILVAAPAPLAPKTSTRRIVLLASIPLAIFCGLIAAIIRRKLDPRIYLAKDMASVIGFYPMASLPAIEEVGEPVHDEFLLRLVGGIDQVHRADQASTFILTAVSGGSNTTGLVSSLAARLQQLGYTVIELRFAELIQELDLPRNVTDSLQSDPTHRTAESTRHENLIVRNLDNIGRHTDLLFIDALPLLSSSESEFATRLSDVVILVAESGLTSRTELADAFALVKRLRVPGVAAVLSELHLQNADEEFITTVHNVERRLSH